MKSKFVNELLDSKENFKDINDIIRKDIIGSKDNSKLKSDIKLKELTKNVILNLPKNKRHWHYGYNTMSDSKKYLDEMTKYYIDTYKKDEFDELISKLDKQEDIFKETYGVGQRIKFKYYKDNKKEELKVTEIGKILIEAGKEAGEKKKAIEIAKKGIDNETIKDLTDLTIEEIETIRNIM